MKKISTLLLGIMALFLTAPAQISFDQVDLEAWCGSGDHEVMFVVDFDFDPVGTDSAFAWGIHFSGDSISGIEIMDLIALSDPDFSYSGSGFLENISYVSNNQTYTNPNAGWFSIVESGDGGTWAWNSGTGDKVGNGQWFGIVAMDPDTWVAEINVPLLQTGMEKHYAQDVMVYPNPASERLYIELDQEAAVYLRTMSGQTVYSASGRIELIELTNILPGLYVLTMVTEDETTSKKIVVK